MNPLRLLIAFACLLLCPVTSQAEWWSVRTPTALVLGDASAKEISRVALRMQQFMEAMGAAFPSFSPGNPVAPVVVVVFKDAKSFKPFQPTVDGTALELRAYGLNGSDVSYLMMQSDGKGVDAERAYYLLAGALISKVRPDAPPWFIEGLAQYFRTFELDGTEARFGKIIQPFILRLRERRMRLDELFSIREEGLLGQDTRTVFLAESWLLMHYVAMGKPERFAPLLSFTDRVRHGEAVGKAFRDAFGFDVATLDLEFHEYLQRRTLGFQRVRLAERLATTIPQPTRLADLDVRVWQADLLAHEDGREAEAAARLDGILKEAPEHIPAHASRGMLLMRQGQRQAALPHLRRAAAGDADNPYVHQYYGAALLDRSGDGLPPPADRRDAMAALKRALELRPAFAAAERHLGYVHILDNQLDQARTVLRRVLDRDPDDREAVLLMARLELREGRLDEARRLLVSGTPGKSAALAEATKNLLVQLDEAQKLRALASRLAAMPPPPPPPPPGSPVRVGGNVQPPARTKHVPPVYPAIAQSARVQGVVIVEAVIGVDGTITDTRVIRSIPLLDQAAIDAVKQWEFAPTLVEGIPTSVLMTVTVQFTLSDSPAPSVPRTAQP